ncbi:MAG: coniferyl aldehyde dehydrogenase [Pseudomonadales bacterium]|nr:coniferyl aldehyde dehydrogenase [Pseudomonadales bacterium]
MDTPTLDRPTQNKPTLNKPSPRDATLSIAPSEEASYLNQEENPLSPILEKQRQAFLGRPMMSAAERVDVLETLAKASDEFGADMVKAVQADFGHRSLHESIALEVMITAAEVKLYKNKIKGWMKPKRAPTNISSLPATGKIHYQPKGVVGVMGTWNGPVGTCLSPAIGAITAGNHVMIKPSDMTPRMADVLAEMIDKHFDDDYLTVVKGDVRVAEQFSRLPFDHLMYTGNTAIGKKIMRAAADNLTPITLEMGGKSPTILSDNFPLKDAVKRILTGKTLNSGQVCVAPDYIMVPRGQTQAFVDEYSQQVLQRFPSITNNDDMTWIVNDRHYQRILHYIEDAKTKGANVHQMIPKGEQIPSGKRVIPYTVITDVNDDMLVMQEEIFGPVLSVVEYDGLDDAINFVQSRPRPLALYYFDRDKRRAESFIDKTISGGACINDTVSHIGHFNMPFGGVGPSGLGAYHGFDGFMEFSHKRAVLYQRSWFAGTALVSQPYSAKGADRLWKIAKWLSK